MQALDAIETRSSALKLREPAPGPADLQRILEAGARAPDHGRLRPWRFVVIDGAGRSALGEALAEFRRTHDSGATERELDNERGKAQRAPMIVAVAARLNAQHKVPAVEQLLAVAACVQNMILAAHAMGYGTMWKTGAAAYDPGVKAALGLDAGDHIVAFVYLGTADSRCPVRPAVIDDLVTRLT